MSVGVQIRILLTSVRTEAVDAQLSDRTPKTVSSDPSGSGQSQFIGAKSVWGRGPRCVYVLGCMRVCGV